MQLAIRNLGRLPYEIVWQEMKQFTDQRVDDSEDEIWLLQHDPVYTLGLNSQRQHLLHTADIPVLQSDRGGQVTYHGPGQLLVYVLLDIRRLDLGVRALVSALENAVTRTLGQYGLAASSRADAPGVYIANAKIASVGLRIRRHCSYHGIALNVDMDLSPFEGINPCGYEGQVMTSLHRQDIMVSCSEVAVPLITHLQQILGYEGLTLRDRGHGGFFHQV